MEIQSRVTESVKAFQLTEAHREFLPTDGAETIPDGWQDWSLENCLKWLAKLPVGPDLRGWRWGDWDESRRVKQLALLTSIRYNGKHKKHQIIQSDDDAPNYGYSIADRQLAEYLKHPNAPRDPDAIPPPVPFQEVPWEKNPPVPLKSLRELIAEPPTESYRVKGILPSAGLCQIFGPSNSGKTFVALSMALSIAAGKDWFDHRVKAGSVLYVSSEGNAFFRCRVKVLADQNNGEIPEKLRVYQSSLDLASECAKSAFITQILDPYQEELDCPPDVIFLDTLNSNFVGDENSSLDMSKVIGNLRKIQSLGNFLIITIHHTGHAERQRSRGHSSLIAALDSELKVNNDQGTGIIELCHTKCRDFARMAPLHFHLVSFPTGWHDEDGEALTSCVLEQCDAPEPSIKLGAKQTEAIESLRKLQGENEWVSVHLWDEKLKEIQSDSSNRAKLKRGLIEKNFVELSPCYSKVRVSKLGGGKMR